MLAYLDNAATTRMCEPAIAALLTGANSFGNPSSLHSLGAASAGVLDNARAVIANMLHVDKNEVFFTSGGTEANNLALLGGAAAMRRRGKKIVTTAIEHASLLEPVRELGRHGFETVFLPPDETGTVDIRAFEDAIDENTVLVSCMSMNNETGAILPVEKIKRVIANKRSPALFHCDATQSFCKYDFSPERIDADLMTVSAHKIHGPKGVGALYIKRKVKILPRVFGGGQENGLRVGTEPLALINSFAAAAGCSTEFKKNAAIASECKQYIIDALSPLDDVFINSPEKSSDYILNFSVLGIRSETMLHFLEQLGVFVSSGSACSKGKQSHVLSACGMIGKRLDGAIRVSFSRLSDISDAKMLVDGVMRARASIIRTK